MKLMIEIEKEDFETIVSKYDTFPVEMKRWGIKAIKSGIPLPDNATNGNGAKPTVPESFKGGSGGERIKTGHLSNKDWVNLLTEQFNVSRTTAKEMLHTMMSVKKEDNFKKQFSGGKNGIS